MPRASEKKILFLDILTDDARIRRQTEKHATGGFYMGNVQRALGLQRNDFVLCHAAGRRFPNPSKFRALVISGSAEDPVRGKEKSWMRRTYVFLRRAAKANVPILGICGGMQFIVRALGGRVVYNPKGLHFGSALLKLTRHGSRDLLFTDLPKKFYMHCNHRCIVPAVRAAWKALASSNLARIEALAIGPHIRLLEFHPEKSVKEMRALAAAHKKHISEAGIRVLIRDTRDAGRAILRNFLKYFIPYRR